ncbi:MAG: hypothetical protein HDP34_01010 [Clostridia bacterium]|nr:hypothetical protein [Clostridia bacterium]
MDPLQMIAMQYQSIMHMQYYFEIAKKQNMHKFILSFEKGDFFHLAGMHKLKDITELQIERNRSVIFEKIISGSISYKQIKDSIFYNNIEKRLFHLENLQELLDSNQIIFQYIENKNKASCIKADYLLENATKQDIVFVFLSERNKKISQDIPIMCCRSFFPMDQLDYTNNQPSYTLLKKIKIDTALGIKTVQYDRSKIIDEAKNAPSEQERRSIMQQLNEKKAQLAISEVLSERRAIQQNRQTPERS